MFIAVTSEIKENIQDVFPIKWRFQAIIVGTLTSKILIINPYLAKGITRTEKRLQGYLK